MGKLDLQELADDIKARGLLNDIVLYQGKVLDGRSRLSACKLAGVEPRFVEWEGEGSPTEWVISQNLFRRHLTTGQRAVVAYDLLPMMEAEAKERQRLSRGRGKKGAQESATFSANGKASEVAARVAHTNARYVEAIKTIGSVARDLIPEIRSGLLTVPEAKDLSGIPLTRRKEALLAIKSDGPKDFLFRHEKKRVRPNTACTPAGICQFLHDLIAPTYKVRTILDPSAGKGALTQPWKGIKVVSFELTHGTDFLAHHDHIACDLVLCNPPFNNDVTESKAFAPELFLKKILQVVGKKTPIVLFAPMGMRLNQEKPSRRWRWMRDESPQITSIIALPLDIFPGVVFHAEILLFNMPRLKPHYFIPEEYLR
jgi:type I restriction enzyme M protein